MLTRRFVDEFELVAALLGLSTDALRERDAVASPLGRWYAIDRGTVVSVASARRRPDDRTFLRFAVTDKTAYEPLVCAADSDLRRALTTHVDGDATDHVHARAAAGFETEVVG